MSYILWWSTGWVRIHIILYKPLVCLEDISGWHEATAMAVEIFTHCIRDHPFMASPQVWTSLVWTNEMIKIRRFSFQYLCWNVYFLDFRPLLKKTDGLKPNQQQVFDCFAWQLHQSNEFIIFTDWKMELFHVNNVRSWGQIARILKKPFSVWFGTSTNGGPLMGNPDISPM